MICVDKEKTRKKNREGEEEEKKKTCGVVMDR